MTNVVSFETAKALKAANFPEPKQIRAGQFLYVDDELCVIVGIDNDCQMYYAPFSDFWVDGDSKEYQNWGAVYEENPNDVFIDGRAFFAPTSADLLAVIFPPEKRLHVGAMDVVKMALKPDLAGKLWIERNKKRDAILGFPVVESNEVPKGEIWIKNIGNAPGMIGETNEVRFRIKECGEIPK